MLHLTHVPRPPLSQFVRLLWLYEGYTQPHVKERVLPTGEMQIVINLLEDKSRIYDRDNTDRYSPERIRNTSSSAPPRKLSSWAYVLSRAVRTRSCGCRRANCATPLSRWRRCGGRRPWI